MIDFSSLRSAMAQLEDALDLHDGPAGEDPRMRVHLRAAAIQAFEFTYELATKLLRRFLEATEASAEVVEELTFNGMIRLATERGLLRSDLETWQAFRKARGTTSHTYDEAKAIDVFESIPGFLQEVRFLLSELTAREEGSGGAAG